MRTYVRLALAATVTLAVAACNNESGTDAGTGGGTGGGGTGGGGTGGGGSSGFPQPAGTVAVSFSIDDRANKVFTASDAGFSDLRWKGSMIYTASTRTVVYDQGWAGDDATKYPPLFDDGPWTSTGHEPAGSTAGDHVWGITVFATPPDAGTQDYGYGAIDSSTGGWLWRGTDGKFTLTAGTTTAQTAAGLVLLAFGDTNVTLALDTGALATRPPLPDGGTSAWDTTTVKVKGSAWAWREAESYDDGTHGDTTASDHKYTFRLSDVVGAGKLAPHSGLVGPGDAPEFVWVLSGVEYKQLAGMSAVLTYADGGTGAPSVALNSKSNPSITVP